jgi:type II secretory pathway component PulK
MLLGRRQKSQRGVILVVVLVFALLLAGTIATFLRRATVDSMISRNRDAAARAESIARGGVRLATVLLIEDKLRAEETGLDIDSEGELWARIGLIEIPVDDTGSTLRLEIRDAGERLNLNAVLTVDEEGAIHDNAAPLLDALLEKVIDEIPIPPGEKLWDRADLVANLIDFVDPDDVRQRGGLEDDVYQLRDPPQRPGNRPLLSVDEVGAVEGFDTILLDALRPYVTVYPYSGEGGINPNTAPPHVLALLFFDDGVDLQLAPEDTVREILRVRQEGGIVCAEDQSDETCKPIGEIVRNAIYPPPSFHSDVFVARAEARVAGVKRTVEAVLDRRGGGEPLLLSWRVL